MYLFTHIFLAGHFLRILPIGFSIIYHFHVIICIYCPDWVSLAGIYMYTVCTLYHFCLWILSCHNLNEPQCVLICILYVKFFISHYLWLLPICFSIIYWAYFMDFSWSLVICLSVNMAHLFFYLVIICILPCPTLPFCLSFLFRM